MTHRYLTLHDHSSRPVSTFYGEAGQAQPRADSGVFGHDASNRHSSYSLNSNAGYANRNSQIISPGAYGHQSGYSQEDGPGHDVQQPDVYGDFNNVASAPKWAARPSPANRYSVAGSTALKSPPFDNESTLLGKKNAEEEVDEGKKRQSYAAGELISTPILGKDFENSDEARRTKVNNDKFTIRGPRLFQTIGTTVKRQFEWKRFIFVVFFLSAIIAILCYFLVPRTPTFQLSADEPLTSNDRSPSFTRIPAVMNWTAELNVAVDGRSNWIPFHFTQLEVGLYDLDTGKKVGSGGLSDRSTFPGREITPTTLDLRFYYRGQNSTDLTWVGYRNACGHKSNGVKRPTLGLNVRIITRIRGMIGETGASTTLANIACPIELPANNA